MKTFEFKVTGLPKGQPRAKAFFNKFTGRAGVYTPGTAEHWKSQIAVAAKEAGLVGLMYRGPVFLEACFYFQRPKQHYGTGKNAENLKESAPKFHLQKPDMDNIEKAAIDALVQIGSIFDDSQIYQKVTSKRWDHCSWSGFTIMFMI